MAEPASRGVLLQDSLQVDHFLLPRQRGSGRNLHIEKQTRPTPGHRVSKRKGSMEKRELGFTLVEVLISLMLLILATTSLLDGLGQAFRHYHLAGSRWRGTIEVWNQIELLRADSSVAGEPVLILPNARPLYRSVIRDSRLAGQSGWEILIAEK